MPRGSQCHSRVTAASEGGTAFLHTLTWCLNAGEAHQAADQRRVVFDGGDAKQLLTPCSEKSRSSTHAYLFDRLETISDEPRHHDRCSPNAVTRELLDHAGGSGRQPLT